MSKHSFRLGGGKWAAKQDKLLAYAQGDISGKYIARELDYSRDDDIEATRVGKDGLIEKGRQNALLQSNKFDTTWSPNGVSVTSGFEGYDGTKDAWKLETTVQSGTTVTRISQTGLDFAGVSTFSVYAKAVTGSGWVRINLLTEGSPNANAYFNVSNGTVGSSPSGAVLDTSITSAGNGFYRISLAYDNSAQDVSEVRIQIAQEDGNEYSAIGSQIYIQDSQLERGQVATTYLESGSTSAKGGLLDETPRIDYLHGKPQLLLEKSRTNQVEFSEYLAHYETVNASVKVNAAISPEGYKNACELIESETATAELHQVNIDNITYAASGEAAKICFSIFMKENTRRYARLRFNTDTADSSPRVWLDLRLGQIQVIDTSNTTGECRSQYYGNGWWRYEFICETTVARTSEVQIFIQGASSDVSNKRTSHKGDGVSSIFIYGAQVETGKGASSYMPTYGVSASRAGDNIDHLSSATDDGLLGNYHTTIYYDGIHTRNETLTRMVTLMNADDDDDPRVLLYSSGTGRKMNISAQYRRQVSGANDDTSKSTGAKFYYNDRFKAILRLNDTKMALFVNGEKRGEVTIVQADDIDRIDLNQDPGSLAHRTNDIQIFPYSLSDTDCEVLTTVTSFSTFEDMRKTLGYKS